MACLGWVDTTYVTEVLPVLPSYLYNCLPANGRYYHDHWVIDLLYLHPALVICIMTNISTTQWVAGLGSVDIGYVTKVLQVLPS